MPKFSKVSMSRLETAHEDLIRLFLTVVKHYDCSIIYGYRGRVIQDMLYKRGKSKVKYPDSQHNKVPSHAVDAYPYINGRVSYDLRQCFHFAGYVKGVADIMGLKIRNGGDWSMDNDVNDQTFIDLGHFELVSINDDNRE